MKCAIHPQLDAVSTCVDCGKGLCSECTDAYEFPICENCNMTRVGEEKGQITKNIVITIVFFIIGFYITMDTSIIGAIWIGYMFAGIPWGWSFLNKITPSIFLFLPLIGWVIYFLIKGLLSLFIGFIALPVKVYQIIRDSKRLQGISETFSNN